MGDAIGDVEHARPARSRVLRGVYFVLGVLGLGLAFLSWLPGIPTVDFVLLAASSSPARRSAATGG